MIEIIEGIDEDIYAQVTSLWAVTGIGRPERGDTLAVVEHTRAREGRFYTARENGRVVGTCWLTTDGRRLLIHHMAVLPDYQHRGIGRMLMEIALAYAEQLEQGCKLEVHEENATARHLYESMDFIYLEGYVVMVRRR